MLRAIVLALLAANLAFWAWTHGWLDGVVGASPHGERDPSRLERQVNVERLQIQPGARAAAADTTGASPGLRPDPAQPADTTPAATAGAAPAGSASAPGGASTAAASAAAAAATTACLEAGPFSPAELVAAEAALVRAALPAGSWTDVRRDTPGAWIIYMGRYADAAQLSEKEEQLRRVRGVSFERVKGLPDLEPGLSLGRFDDRGAADAALADLGARGVRSARVVTVAAPATTYLVRVERADAALQQRLATLKAPSLGAGFKACAPGR